MAKKTFFGSEAASTGNYYTDTHYTTWFQSSYSGVITDFRVLANASGNIKVSVYEGTNWDTATLLSSEDTGTAVTSGTNDIAITNFNVVASNYYWLAGNSDTNNVITFSAAAGGVFRQKAATYSTFTAPDPPGSGYSSAGVVLRFAALGWEPPVISTIDDSSIGTGQTRTLTGTDFMTAANPIKVEICNNSDYSLATVKVEQTVTSQSDTSVDFTCVTTGLSGPNYVFVTTDLGQMNTTGTSVNVPATAYMWISRNDGNLSAYPHLVVIA